MLHVTYISPSTSTRTTATAPLLSPHKCCHVCGGLAWCVGVGAHVHVVVVVVAALMPHADSLHYY